MGSAATVLPIIRGGTWVRRGMRPGRHARAMDEARHPDRWTPGPKVLALLALWGLAYSAAYFHGFARNMLVHFLRLPGKAPALWKWLDLVF
jgi:hypothetical protein